ncbi:hypothetical protein M472_16300 [Sphingobacterium paucimobilis HER1398]|uniref:Thioredoxin domain-containing protein n=2 Tax=Sphingobacterium TaxID=28453 RepID=U2HRF0_9SPHI|nr:hypothetical protein M472_03730 [Sphingobacterium paucimobilis HER1398]ERJ60321.1 hypothetical protein M472_16300 [Sphingobacterium paucimobilis HER1398]
MRIIYTAVGLLAAQLAFGQVKIKVIGHVTGDTEGHNKVYIANRMATDSAVIKDGRFEVEFEDQGVGSRSISIEYDRAKRRMYSPLVVFYDQSGTVEVEFDVVKGLSSGKVKGLESAAAYYNYNQEKSKIFMAAFSAAKAKYGEDALKKESAHFDEATSFKDELMVRLNDSLLNIFVKADAMVSPVFILSQASSLPVDRLEAYYNRLSERVKAGDDAQSLYARIQGLRNAYIGAVVKDFQLPDQHGKAQSFEQFKGKYVLLDFWASWCSPCRASFPRVREVYSKLQGKSFEIVNVSIDQNKQAWLKAVGEESNPWPQLYDDSKISSALFNVSAVPTCYLIDPSGKIIMKEIGFDPKGGGEMEKKLEEIFKVKF